MTTADGIPFRELPTKEAILKLISGKAISVEDHPTRLYRSQYVEIPAPLVISSLRYVQLPKHFYGKAKLTNPNLFARDVYHCKYCGETGNLTRDHVIPISRGGTDTWDNVVTACTHCNNKKGDRTPEEAGMRLNIVPKEPVKLDIIRKKSAHKLRKLQEKDDIGRRKRKN